MQVSFICFQNQGSAGLVGAEATTKIPLLPCSWSAQDPAHDLSVKLPTDTGSAQIVTLFR